MIKFLKKYQSYLYAIILTIIALYLGTEISGINWHVPLIYEGDTTWTLSTIKSLIHYEWFPWTTVKSDYLAAPFGYNIGDFPNTEHLFYIIIQFLGLLSSDYGLVYNLFVVLSYILSTVVFLYVSKKLNIHPVIGIAFGLLFAFLPFRFWRLGHLFLSFYSFIPLILLVLISLWDEVPPFYKKQSEKLSIALNNSKSWITCATIFITASTGIYYSFFFAFFVLVAITSSYIINKNRAHIISGIIIISALIGMLLINMTPHFLYVYNNGANTLVGQRHPQESETFGLKLTNIALPLGSHHISALRKPAEKYYSYNSALIEGANEYIGIFALLGLIVLFIRMMVIKKKAEIYDRLGPIVISGFFLSTVGGIGSLFALLITPTIRGYNRISILLATCGLLAIALCVENMRKKFPTKIFYPLIVLIVVFGLYDQIPSHTYFMQHEIGNYLNDHKFVQEIEKSVPENSNILQLPFAPFPEIPPIYKMGDYSHFRGYLNSNTLKWSYGAVKGRPDIQWYQQISSYPTQQMVEQLIVSQFKGIYIDRNGYEDNAAKLENELRILLNEDPIESDNSRLLFFKLPDTMPTLQNVSNEQAEKMRKKALMIVQEIWGGECSGLEGDQSLNWRWCGNDGTLTLHNRGNENETVTIKMIFGTWYPEDAHLTIIGPDINKTLVINNEGTAFSHKITLKPGKTTFELQSDAQEVTDVPDPRELVFRIFNFVINYE